MVHGSDNENDGGSEERDMKDSFPLFVLEIEGHPLFCSTVWRPWSSATIAEIKIKASPSR